MIALGVDPGTRNLGWGVVTLVNNRLTHVAHGVIRANTDDPLSARLLVLAQALEKVIHQYKPEVGSVEGMFFEKNAQSAAKLGHARGVVLLCLEKYSVPVREHAPARVKRTLTGNGRAEKSQVAQMVKAILNLESAPPADAADALAIAITELRLDPRAHELKERMESSRRKQLPAHFREALLRTRAARRG